jgi:localization factor PodJL
MQGVLGQRAPQPPLHAVQPSPARQPSAPVPDLQTRLAAIAKNIETLESKVVGRAAPSAPAPASPHPEAAMPSAPQDTGPEPAPRPFDPLEALRRRKHELEQAASPSAPDPHAEPTEAAAESLHEPVSRPSAQPTSQVDPSLEHAIEAAVEAPTPQIEPVPSQVPQSSMDALVARLDEQFSRLTQAVGDVRTLAETSAADQAGLHQQVAALQAQVDIPDRAAPRSVESSPAPSADLAQLSNQIRAVQDAIASMPKPEAIQSLEEGYRHVLARLDSLKGVGTHEEKIDALYNEVTSLREVLDNLGENDTSALVGEMRAMISQLEHDPAGNADRINQALEGVKEMARGAAHDPSQINEAIGAVVERLVALEARIEALASSADDSAVTQRLDAIQSEMARLSTFQDEARGLTSALETIRQEMRAATPAVDLSDIDQRFSALDRIEEMTGGYAAQVAEFSQRLNALDGRLANQSDMAHEVAALSRRLDAFSSTMPVREIEHALLDLTGRVTALQEDTGTERLGMAVRELGERVESCLKSIPKTEAIVEAVEARLDSRITSAIAPVVTRLNGVDAHLDGMQRAISAADAPLIDHLSNRLEGLIAAMPTPLADVALASLESQLVELNKRHADAGVVSREDVTRLHNELARARASVELGSNRDLQRSIVDQVRHLASRFDAVRATGDAELLPEIEGQIDDLAHRFQTLGLFDPQTLTQDALGMEALQSELISLRQHASAQDQQMMSTLESIQSALETVVGRLDALETDDKAARSLAEDVARQPALGSQPLPEVAHASPPKAPEPVSLPSDGPASIAGSLSAFDSSPVHDALPPVDLPPQRNLPAGDALSDGADGDDEPAPLSSNQEDREPGDLIPAPGDAQTLLRQLSGAINASPERPSRSSPGAEGPAGAARSHTPPQSGEAGAQRANFIAAARRAAQAAALQAGGGQPPAPGESLDAADPNVAGTRARRSAASKTDTRADTRLEPGLETDQELAGSRETPAFDNPLDLFSGSGKTSGRQKRAKQAKDGKDQRSLSRTMIIALLLLTVGLGVLVVSLILPGQRAADTVIAPLTPSEAPAGDGAQATPDLGAVGEQSVQQPVRDVGDAPEVALSTEPTTNQQTPDAPAGDVPSAQAADPLPSVADALTQETPLSSGFEPGRGPVMVQTPQLDDAAAQAPVAGGAPVEQGDILPPPANDLGPLLNLPIPPLPAATADALPEEIGSPRLRVAAVGGDAAAAFEIATRFMEGRSVPQDLGAAAHWYGRAADQGLIPAAYRLGSFYEQGRGVDRDRDAAIAWYERAALGGNPRAMHNLAVMAAEGGGQAPDFARAAGWFIPAANRGLADSQFNLAVLFARGMGVERDLMESYKWFALAANGGDSEAVGRRDEVAGVLGEQALALARARVENWRPVPVERTAIAVEGPAGGWEDSSVRAGGSQDQRVVAEAQALLAERGYNPGPADGMVGPRTSEAVRAFRQSVGLGDSAVIDQALLDALRQGVAL